MTSISVALGVSDALDLFDCDLRNSNVIAHKAASLITVEELISYGVQEHLIK